MDRRDFLALARFASLTALAGLPVLAGRPALAAPPSAPPNTPPNTPPGGPPGATPRLPLLIPGKQSLYQRVITRPGAMLTAQPGGGGGRPVAGFSIFYVYARQGGDGGSIEIGRTADGHTEGWIPTERAIDWEHTMIGAFTNPAHRQPVLFLNSADAVRRVLLDPDPAAQSQQLRAGVTAGNPGPVIAIEPTGAYANIDERFYLLPILSAQMVQRDRGGAERVLEVVSAPADSGTPRPPPNDALANFRAGLVFLVDTTMSMQPFIELTRTEIRNTVDAIGQTALRDKFRFGLVAYRDSLADTPALEYATRVYAQPDFSQPPGAILPAIAAVQEARVSSLGFDEDPLGGLKTAIDEINWSNLAGRFVVLVTDSGARTARHPHSLTHMDIDEMRAKAKQAGVTVFVIHLLTEEGRRLGDHPHARAQYLELTRQDSGDPLYFPVEGGTPANFAVVAQQLVNGLLQQVSAITHVPVPALAHQGAAAPPPSAAMQERLRVVAEAARLAYLGRVEHTEAPDIIRAWTTDVDLADPSITALDVRLLLSRNQLSNLTDRLQHILDAMNVSGMAPQDMFSSLREAFATAARGQNTAMARTLGGLLNEYLADLPYQSQIASIDEADWLGNGDVYRENIRSHVESCVAFYQDRQTRPETWFDLTHSGQPGEAVTPIPIDQLP
jgi:serine/threonine-protein kinase PpkA